MQIKQRVMGDQNETQLAIIDHRSSYIYNNKFSQK